MAGASSALPLATGKGDGLNGRKVPIILSDDSTPAQSPGVATAGAARGSAPGPAPVDNNGHEGHDGRSRRGSSIGFGAFFSSVRHALENATAHKPNGRPDSSPAPRSPASRGIPLHGDFADAGDGDDDARRASRRPDTYRYYSLAAQRRRMDREWTRLALPNLEWRISHANRHYELSATYPPSFIVPRSLDDDFIRRAAAQRSGGRLPTLVWVHPSTGAPLCRSAQPMQGMTLPAGMQAMGGVMGFSTESLATTLHEDEKLLHALRVSMRSAPAAASASASLASTPPDATIAIATAMLRPRGGESAKLAIIDARPKLNAQALKLSGKGCESSTALNKSQRQRQRRLEAQAAGAAGTLLEAGEGASGKVGGDGKDHREGTSAAADGGAECTAKGGPPNRAELVEGWVEGVESAAVEGVATRAKETEGGSLDGDVLERDLSDDDGHELDRVEVRFLGIENVHTMRESLDSLADACAGVNSGVLSGTEWAIITPRGFLRSPSFFSTSPPSPARPPGARLRFVALRHTRAHRRRPRFCGRERRMARIHRPTALWRRAHR